MSTDRSIFWNFKVVHLPHCRYSSEKDNYEECVRNCFKTQKATKPQQSQPQNWIVIAVLLLLLLMLAHLFETSFLESTFQDEIFGDILYKCIRDVPKLLIHLELTLVPRCDIRHFSRCDISHLPRSDIRTLTRCDIRHLPRRWCQDVTLGTSLDVTLGLFKMWH